MKAAKTRIPLEIPSKHDPSFRWMVIALIVLAEVMVYTSSLIHGLVADDFVFREFHNRSLSSFWSQASDIHGHWRPLSYSLKHILFSVFGETAFPWHALNVLVHLTSVLVFFHLLLRLSESFEKPRLIGPMIATIIFQVHPAAVQNVYWASGLSDLLCMLFLLVATLISVKLPQEKKRPIVWAAFLFAAALLSKESAITYPLFLVLMLYLVLGSWQEVLTSHKRLLVILTLLSVAFGAVFVLVSGRMLSEQPGLLDGTWGVLLRGFGMLVVPTDAMRLYQLGAEAPLGAAGLGSFLVFVLVLLFRQKLLNARLLALFAMAFLGGFLVYAVGGFISLRLMYASVGFFTMAMFVVLTRKPWWNDSDIVSRILRWSVLLYVIATSFFAFSAVMDWHVADKFAGAIRASFVDHHLAVQERQYVFGAIPSRLRQAEIVGEPGTDFRGQLRQEEMSDSVDMRALLRIVLLDRDDVSANVLLLRTSGNSLIVNTQTENQFFLIGKVDTPNELPIGTKFADGVYSLEVLETTLNDRAVTVKVTVNDPADLDRLLFYDDQDRQFISLKGIEAMPQDETDE